MVAEDPPMLAFSVDLGTGTLPLCSPFPPFPPKMNRNPFFAYPILPPLPPCRNQRRTPSTPWPS